MELTRVIIENAFVRKLWVEDIPTIQFALEITLLWVCYAAGMVLVSKQMQGNRLDVK